MIDCPPPYAADDADSFRCGNGVEIRIAADLHGNNYWLDAPERACGAINKKGKMALQGALDSGVIEVFQAWDSHKRRLAKNRDRLISVVNINGIAWHITAVELGLARVVHRDDYRHGECPKEDSFEINSKTKSDYLIPELTWSYE